MGLSVSSSASRPLWMGTVLSLRLSSGSKKTPQNPKCLSAQLLHL